MSGYSNLYKICQNDSCCPALTSNTHFLQPNNPISVDPVPGGSPGEWKFTGPNLSDNVTKLNISPSNLK